MRRPRSTLDDKPYAAGTLVIPMSQVFARYAKDLLEKQTYPEVRRGPNLPPEPPYDVTAWSLGMQFGVTSTLRAKPLPAVTPHARDRTAAHPRRVNGTGPRFVFDYTGADSAIAVNRLLTAGAKVAFTPSSQPIVEGAQPERCSRRSLAISASRSRPRRRLRPASPTSRSSRCGCRGSRCMRRGPAATSTRGGRAGCWSRYQFPYTAVHNAEIRAGGLRRRFDAIVLADQSPREIVDGNLGASIRPEYRGGIGDIGVDSLQRFVSEGGTLIALGAASDLIVDRFPVPVRDQKRALRRDQHFAPGTILRIQVDTSQPDRLRHGRRHLRLLQQQPVLHAGRRIQRDEGVGDRPLSERGHRRVGVAARRGRDGGTGGGGRSGHEAGADCAVRPAATAPRPDARHLPDAVQRALSVGREASGDYRRAAQ